MTFHYESTYDNVESVIQRIKDQGMKAGLGLKPCSFMDPTIQGLLDKGLLDMVLVMTIEPGFGGQSFMPEMLPKIKEIRDAYPDVKIQVDGGIKCSNVKDVAEAGADVIVSGTGIVYAEDRAATIKEMRDVVNSFY